MDIVFVLSLYGLFLFILSLPLGLLLQYFLHRIPFLKIGIIIYLVIGIYFLVRTWTVEFTLLSVTAGSFCFGALLAIFIRKTKQRAEEQMQEDVVNRR